MRFLTTSGGQASPPSQEYSLQYSIFNISHDKPSLPTLKNTLCNIQYPIFNISHNMRGPCHPTLKNSLGNIQLLVNLLLLECIQISFHENVLVLIRSFHLSINFTVFSSFGLFSHIFTSVLSPRSTFQSAGVDVKENMMMWMQGTD